MFGEINEFLVVRGSVTLKGVKYPCLVWIGGDMAFISSLFGLGARFAVDGHNCIWCEVHSKDLWKSGRSTPRTLRRLYNLGHMPVPSHNTDDGPQFPFQCPGCKKNFLCEADVEADRTRGPKSALQKRNYLKTHFGVGHMTPPLVDIPLWMVILCMLHMVLSVVKTLWLRQVVSCITTLLQADHVNGMLKSWGCHVK